MLCGDERGHRHRRGVRQLLPEDSREHAKHLVLCLLCFGGVMGWNFADDPDHAWVTGIGQALGISVPTPPPGVPT
jgi:hypothetical protein